MSTSRVELEADRRAWAAISLAADVDAAEGLIVGLPVPRDRLLADVLERVGEPRQGPPIVLDDALALRLEVSRGNDQPDFLPFAGRSHAQVLNMTFETQRFLVEDLIEPGVVTVIAGVPETHKSWLAQSIGIGVARGRGEVLGREIVGTGAVGYWWQDDSTRLEAERIQLYARVHETPSGLPIVWFLNEGARLPDDIGRIRATVLARELVLVVIDSFYNFAVGADLKDRDAGAIFATLKAELCDPTGATVLVVDHMPWATDTNRTRLRTYGDVFKGAAVRAGIYVDAVNDKLYVEARGNNIRGFKRTPAYWHADALELRLVDTAAVDAEELDELVLTWLVEHPGQHSKSTVRAAIPRRNTDVDAALERLKERDRVRDLGRDGGTWSGQAGTPRYWVATVHADSTPSQLFGTGSDDLGPEGTLNGPSDDLVPSPIGGTGSGRDRVPAPDEHEIEGLADLARGTE